MDLGRMETKIDYREKRFFLGGERGVMRCCCCSLVARLRSMMTIDKSTTVMKNSEREKKTKKYKHVVRFAQPVALGCRPSLARRIRKALLRLRERMRKRERGGVRECILSPATRPMIPSAANNRPGQV